MSEDGQDTRARLLACARDLYLEQGLTRFSLREVARRVDLSPAAVYRHFDSKEALLGEACAAGFRIFASYLVQALAAPTARARMAACAERYVRFALENRRDYRVMFMSSAEDMGFCAPATLDSARGPTFQFLVDRVVECVHEGLLRKTDPTETALVIWAHVHGLVSLRLCGHLESVGSDASFVQFFVSSTEQLLTGLTR